MLVDWFRFAALPVDEARQRFGVVAKAQQAVGAGSSSPWGPGGISTSQSAGGRRLADTLVVPYDAFGATPPPD